MKTAMFRLVIPLFAVALVAGCSSTPKPKESLESSGQLKPSPEFPNSLIYKKEGEDFKKYVRFQIDPVALYQGADAEFKKVSEADKQMIADWVKSEFTRILQQDYAVVDSAGPDVMRIKFTLAGIQTTQPALATVSHLLPIGMVMNLGKSAAGSKGSFMGSVVLAGEMYDSQDNTRVAAFLTRKGPNAMDLTAALTSLQAAKTAVTEMAEKFKATIDKVQGKVKKD